jgi:protein phosphatase 2C family protein 2/3
VISQSGKAVDLTRDHKPHLPEERQRIESSGGFVCTEGLLNGELGVARAIGDYHIPELKQLDAGG